MVKTCNPSLYNCCKLSITGKALMQEIQVRSQKSRMMDLFLKEDNWISATGKLKIFASVMGGTVSPTESAGNCEGACAKALSTGHRMASKQDLNFIAVYLKSEKKKKCYYQALTILTKHEML